MARSTTTPTPLNIDTTDWEVINDDGFVYKRLKRRVDPTSLSRPQDPESDPALELKLKRKRKRQRLLNLKEKYERELSQWDILSNTLTAMQKKASSKQIQDIGNAVQERETGNKNNNDGFQSVGDAEKTCGSLVDELRMQVEAQEAVIRNIEQLCDVVDSFCNAHEEKVNQQFFDLPIWILYSPQELMASLCED